jgi:hypothetical protein
MACSQMQRMIVDEIRNNRNASVVVIERRPSPPPKRNECVEGDGRLVTAFPVPAPHYTRNSKSMLDYRADLGTEGYPVSCP